MIFTLRALSPSQSPVCSACRGFFYFLINFSWLLACRWGLIGRGPVSAHASSRGCEWLPGRRAAIGWVVACPVSLPDTFQQLAHATALHCIVLGTDLLGQTGASITGSQQGRMRPTVDTL